MKTLQCLVIFSLILFCPLLTYAQQPLTNATAKKSIVYQNKELRVYASKSKTGVISYEGYGADGGQVTLKKIKSGPKTPVGGGGKGDDCATCCGYDKKGRCTCWDFGKCKGMTL